jgi:uncharacterized membrane protein YebE (DUF533 family)
MFDGKRLLDQFLGGQTGTGGQQTGGGGNLGGIAGGALAGGLTGLLTGTKTGRKIGKNALTYGGIALLGGLAYKGWSDWKAGKKASPAASPAAVKGEMFAPPPAGTPFLPETGTENALGRALVRAMIGAAKADGHIDANEQQRIFARVTELDLDAEEKAFVMDELARPLDLDAIAAGAACPETAAEVYAASLIAVDPALPANKGYLSMLAARLKLDPALVDHLHANVDRAMA